MNKEGVLVVLHHLLRLLFFTSSGSTWVATFSDAGKNILSKASLGNGMSQYILVVYTHAFATLSIAPFAFILKRPVMNQIFYWPEVYICYLLIHHEQHLAGHDLRGWRAYRMVLTDCNGRMEKVDLKMVYRDIPSEGGRDSGHRCWRHVDGNLQRTSNGAGLEQAYRFSWIQLTGRHRVEQQQLVYGLLLPHLVHISFGFFVSPLEETLKQYSARLSLMTWIHLVGTLQATTVTFVLEHKRAVWTIGFDINFLAAAYSVSLSLSLSRWVIEQREAVFASAFSPLRMIVVAITGVSILNEKIYLGGVLGAVLIVIGLYSILSILWGNSKEE
ncbi:Auxin-induced protein [Musa troglodytarum]|uniref:Auxin-induced protein n=1 Tax=Musa troglodytarum TaxID=320322 RepID=A0A9E7GPT0_9LILI|nr:Auxin-induced protein [Musa troglodytarum]